MASMEPIAHAPSILHKRKVRQAADARQRGTFLCASEICYTKREFCRRERNAFFLSALAIIGRSMREPLQPQPPCKEFRMRCISAVLFSAFAIAVTANAASAGQPQPQPQHSALTPGHAAGIREAEIKSPTTPVLVAGGALLVGGLALVLSGHDHDHTPGTGTTSTTGTR
jgi:hypothetical protein